MPETTVRIVLLGPNDGGLLADVDPDVFDEVVRPDLVREVLTDPRHHLAVAIDGTRVVGFASGVHYVHPDKPAELWINEVGVASSHRGRGLAKELLSALFEVGVRVGCRQAWVLTERDNVPARRLYASVGGREATEEITMFEFRLDVP